MLDDFFGTSFFGGHDPLFGKHGRNLMKTDIRETDDARVTVSQWICPALKRTRSMWMSRTVI